MASKNFVIYSILRILCFAVPFGIMMIFPIMREFWWLSAIFAALIGLSLSSLLLNKRLNSVSEGLAAKRAAKKRPDAAAQDAAAEDAIAEELDNESAPPAN